MLKIRGLFIGLSFEDPYVHMDKCLSVCESYLGMPELDMDVIGLRLFPLSLIGDVVMWFLELPYNSIYIKTNSIRCS